MTIHIPSEFHGRMLRSYLKHTLSLSTATLAQLKNNEHGILINGHRVTVRHILQTGDVLELADRDTAETATHSVLPVDLPLNILYEDEQIMALNKPAGMPTHPSHGHLTDTLANALAWRYAQAGQPFVFRPLGRLDRNTSGVVIVGKTRAASGSLGASLQKGEVIKRYIAILEGRPTNMDGQRHIIDAPIHRPDAMGIKRAVCPPDTPASERAVTVFRVLAVSEHYTLVLAEPKTGRTHQLRVHFAHIGHPIVGDELYGSPSELIGRHALHALSLSVPMPFARAMGESSGATPACTNVPTETPWNIPSPDGYLHTWAPLPYDMAVLTRRFFPAFDLFDGIPHVGRSILLPHTHMKGTGT